MGHVAMKLPDSESEMLRVNVRRDITSSHFLILEPQVRTAFLSSLLILRYVEEAVKGSSKGGGK